MGDGKVRIFLHHSSVPFNLTPVAPTAVPEAITEAEVRAAQNLWSESIKKISAAYLNKEDFKSVAGQAAGDLYAYGHANVLFKPTKAKDTQFRPMAADAMGNYYFTDATAGDVTQVEYTFGYERCNDDKVRIFLHHSSVPFNP